MGNTLVRVYDRLADAEGARNELLSLGFPPSCINIDSRMDESGPVEGNFILDAKETGTSPDLSKDGLTAADDMDNTDAYHHDTPIWRSTFTMTVDADDEEQRRRASDIMERFGAVDVDTLVARRRGNA